MKKTTLIRNSLPSNLQRYSYYVDEIKITDIEVGPDNRINIILLNQMLSTNYTFRNKLERLKYICDKFYIWLRVYRLYEVLTKTTGGMGDSMFRADKNYVKMLKDKFVQIDCTGRISTTRFLSTKLTEEDVKQLNTIYKKYKK